MHENETDNQVTGSNQSQSPLKKHFRISRAIQSSPVLVVRVQSQREVWFKEAFYLFFLSLHSEVLLRLTSSCIYFAGKWEMINNSLDGIKNKRKLFLYLKQITLNGDKERHFFSMFAIYECASVITVFIFYFN